MLLRCFDKKNCVLVHCTVCDENVSNELIKSYEIICLLLLLQEQCTFDGVINDRFSHKNYTPGESMGVKLFILSHSLSSIQIHTPHEVDRGKKETNNSQCILLFFKGQNQKNE